MKPSLSWGEQVALLVGRGVVVGDEGACAAFLAAHNYYRFSGYMRYFQTAPHLGDNTFRPDTPFDEIREIYDADEALRAAVARQLARAEILLRTHTAHVIANEHGPSGRYLKVDFYTDAANAEPTVESYLKDIERSSERHILRYTAGDRGVPTFTDLPVWSAVEAFSFGTLSKCIERGGQGTLADAVATSRRRQGRFPVPSSSAGVPPQPLRAPQPVVEPLRHRRRPDAKQRAREGQETRRTVRAEIRARRHRFTRRHRRPREGG